MLHVNRGVMRGVSDQRGRTVFLITISFCVIVTSVVSTVSAFEGALILRHKTDSSLGQLVRRSQLIVLGEIQEYVSEKGFAIQPERYYWGHANTEDDVVWVQFMESDETPPYAPSVGERGILFATRKWVYPSRLRTQWITVDDIDGSPLPGWTVLGGDRGFLRGDAERLGLLEEVLAGYIHHIRVQETDLISYVKFLAGLSESSDERVREDFSFDLMAIRKVPLWRRGKDELLADPETPAIILERIERARRFAEKSIRLRDRAQVEAEFERAGWEEAMQSGDKWEIDEALRVLSRINYYEKRQYPDLWVPFLRDLLEHEDFDVRVWAAGHLSIVQEREAVPILLEALRDPDWQRFGGPSLRRITGQDFPFDPTAPEEEREAMIRRWEEWWARQLLEE